MLRLPASVRIFFWPHSIPMSYGKRPDPSPSFLWFTEGGEPGRSLNAILAMRSLDSNSQAF